MAKAGRNGSGAHGVCHLGTLAGVQDSVGRSWGCSEVVRSAFDNYPGLSRFQKEGRLHRGSRAFVLLVGRLLPVVSYFASFILRQRHSSSPCSKIWKGGAFSVLFACQGGDIAASVRDRSRGQRFKQLSSCQFGL